MLCSGRRWKGKPLTLAISFDFILMRCETMNALSKVRGKEQRREGGGDEGREKRGREEGGREEGRRGEKKKGGERKGGKETDHTSLLQRKDLLHSPYTKRWFSSFWPSYIKPHHYLDLCKKLQNKTYNASSLLSEILDHF